MFSDPTPSQDDMILTRRLVDADKLLGVDVLDHIVVGGSRYVSLQVARLSIRRGLLERRGCDRAGVVAAST
jgi:hypothetical protein